jgi:hypothetical protein
MTDVLMAVGVLVVMAVIVVALLRIAPRHEKEMTNAFEEFSMQHALRYFAEDDGRVPKFAADFEGLGDLGPGSAQGAMPRDVVSGVLDGQHLIVFRYGARQSEGSEPEWNVAGLEVKNPLADRCAVQFCRGELDREETCISDPIVKEHDAGSFKVLVRAGDAAGAGRLVEEEVLEKLAARAEQVAFRPELQVRGNRVIAYPADHGTRIHHANDLDGLMGLAKRTVIVAG